MRVFSVAVFVLGFCSLCIANELVHIVPVDAPGGTGGPVIDELYNDIHSGDMVPKPTCASGAPAIYITPTEATTPDRIMGLRTWAEDVGSFWRVEAAVKGMDGNIYTGSDYIVMAVYVTCR